MELRKGVRRSRANLGHMCGRSHWVRPKRTASAVSGHPLAIQLPPLPPKPASPSTSPIGRAEPRRRVRDVTGQAGLPDSCPRPCRPFPLHARVSGSCQTQLPLPDSSSIQCGHVRRDFPINPRRSRNAIYRKGLWCRRSDLNRGPADYESAALPLSYVGNRRKPRPYTLRGHPPQPPGWHPTVYAAGEVSSSRARGSLIAPIRDRTSARAAIWLIDR